MHDEALNPKLLVPKLAKPSLMTGHKGLPGSRATWEVRGSQVLVNTFLHPDPESRALAD